MKLLKSQNSFGDERFTISVEEQNCKVTAQILVSQVGQGEKVISYTDKDYLNCFFESAVPTYKENSSWLGEKTQIITFEFRTGNDDNNVKNLLVIRSLLEDPDNGIKDKDDLNEAKLSINQELKKYPNDIKGPIEESCKEKIKTAKETYNANHQKVVMKK